MWLKVIVLMSVFFLSGAQPMMLVTMMVMIVLFYSLEMYKMVMTFWYSIVLMMVVLSGVMVIFTYMASMAPNEKFDLTVWGFMVLLLFSMGWAGWWEGMKTVESLEIWNFMVMMVNEFMVGFLLTIMVMVVWVSSWWFGPVRVYWKN